MLHLPIVGLLVFAVPASTPAPPASTAPTPVTASSGRPRTLSDLARERKGKPKPQGGVSLVETSTDGASDDGDAESGPSKSGSEGKSKAPASLRVLEATNEGVDRRGSVMFQGSVQNAGEAAACDVRLSYALLDERGKYLASGTASISRVDKGATARFSGRVSVPPNTFNASNRVSSGDPDVQIRYVGRGSAEVTGASACR